MPFTTPLAELPVTWPSAETKIVNEDRTPTPEFLRWINQVRRYLAPVDAALDELEP